MKSEIKEEIEEYCNFIEEYINKNICDCEGLDASDFLKIMEYAIRLYCIGDITRK